MQSRMFSQEAGKTKDGYFMNFGTTQHKQK